MMLYSITRLQWVKSMYIQNFNLRHLQHYMEKQHSFQNHCGLTFYFLSKWCFNHPLVYVPHILIFAKWAMCLWFQVVQKQNKAELKHHINFMHLTMMHILEWITNMDWLTMNAIPDSKGHEANMEPTWVLSAPDGPHVGPRDLAIRDGTLLESTQLLVRQVECPITTTNQVITRVVNTILIGYFKEWWPLPSRLNLDILCVESGYLPHSVYHRLNVA